MMVSFMSFFTRDRFPEENHQRYKFSYGLRFQRIHALYPIPKVQQQRSPILARGHDPPVIALRRQNPRRRPVWILCHEPAFVVTVHPYALVVAAGDDAVVRRIQKQASHQPRMASVRMRQLGRCDAKLVNNGVVAACKHGGGVGAELDSCQAAVLRHELLDAHARREVPELGGAVAGCRDEQIAAQLDGVDGPAVALKAFEQFARLA